MKNLFCSLILLSLLFPYNLDAQNVKLVRSQGQTKGFEMKFEGLDRKFIVHFPSSYKQNQTRKFPVVFMLHGGGGTGMKYYNISGWKELGEREGIITVYPTAYPTCLTDYDSGKSDTDNYWLTTGKAKLLCKGEKFHDDASFIRAVAEYLKNNFRVNKKRFYCTGFSNGMGFTLTRTLPELSDIFAAAGGAGSLMQEAMVAANPIPTFAMIGEKDPKFVKRRGGTPFPTTEAGMKTDAFLQTQFSNFTQLLQVEQDYSVIERKKHTTYRFSKTKNGGSQVLQFSILVGLKHVYPRGIPEHNNIKAAEVFWDFFKQYSK